MFICSENIHILIILGETAELWNILNKHHFMEYLDHKYEAVL